MVTIASSALALQNASVSALIAVGGIGALVQGSTLLGHAYAITHRQQGNSPDVDDSRQPIMEMVRFSGAMQANGVTAFINSQTDRLVIAGIAGAAAVAPFEAANTAVRMVRIIPSQLLIAVIPQIAAALDRPAALTHIFNDALQKLTRITFSLSGLLIAVSPVAFHLWLGSLPHNLLPMTISLVLCNAVNMLTGPGTTLLRTAGRPALEIAYSSITTVVNVALSILLGLEYGALGVVLATAISTSAASVLFLAVFKRVMHVTWSEESRRVVWRVGLGSTITGLILMATGYVLLGRTTAFFPLLVALAATTAAFAVLSLVWDRTLLSALAWWSK
jgi:O-antigen/teichoic acid export membrane protein